MDSADFTFLADSDEVRVEPEPKFPVPADDSRPEVKDDFCSPWDFKLPPKDPDKRLDPEVYDSPACPDLVFVAKAEPDLDCVAEDDPLLPRRLD